MSLVLYYHIFSAPCRAVLLTGKALGVSFNLKEIQLMKGEHMTPQYLKLNPQHTIPTLVDKTLVLSESRAIIAYLADKYGKNDTFYPKCPKARAIVNQRLFFDIGVLYQRFADYFFPMAFGGAPLDVEKKKKLEEAFEILDKYLEGTKYAAADRITIADHSLAASVSTIEASGFDISKYQNVNKWFTLAKNTIVGYDEINQKGVDLFRAITTPQIDLYYHIFSAPCRAVLLTGKALGVSFNLKEVKLMKGEHMTPEYIKMNPQHTIPTMVDKKFTLSESRAIISYLADEYGKDDSLYPKCPKARAVINQRLFFDIGVLYQRFADYFFPMAFGGAPLDVEKKKKLEEAFEILDKYLEGTKYAAADRITIADHSLAASVSTIEASGFNISKYQNVNDWFKLAKNTIVGYDEINQKGADLFKAITTPLKK